MASKTFQIGNFTVQPFGPRAFEVTHGYNNFLGMLQKHSKENLWAMTHNAILSPAEEDRWLNWYPTPSSAAMRYGKPDGIPLEELKALDALAAPKAEDVSKKKAKIESLLSRLNDPLTSEGLKTQTRMQLLRDYGVQA